MYTNKTICVFCSSSNKIKKEYLDQAYNLGKLLAEKNITCLNGGGIDDQGSMAQLNKAIFENKGKNISIIHEMWIDKKNYKKHPHINEEIILTNNDLSERKKIMRNKSDAFIVLPGGTGTIDEMMEIIELKKSGFMTKEIFIVNTNGFFDPIINFIKLLKKEKFMKQDINQIINIINDINQLKI